MQASPAEDRSFLWSVPGKRVAVDLPLSVVARLTPEILGALATDGRGVEVGGLLLGRARRQRGRTVVHVDDFEPLACEHVAGPSFMLSAADRQALEARLRRRKGAVVGFYRSNTRREFAVTVEDVALMGWYFSHPSQVLLLIHAGKDEPLRGAFAVWDGRAMTQKADGDEFPFVAAALAERSHAAAPMVVPAAPAKGGRAGWYAAAAVVVGLSAGVLYERQPSAPAAAAPRRAEASRPSDVVPTPAIVPEPAPAGIAPAAPAPAAPQPTAPQRAEFTATTVAPRKAIQTADRRVLEPPPPVSRTAAPAEIAEPPAIAAPSLPASAETLAVLSSAIPTAAPAPIPAPPDPLVSVSVNAVTRGRGPKFVPPAAVRQVRPEIPADLRRRLTRDVQVQVKVYVDRDGKVQYAELLSNGMGENRELASLAVFASRKWQFAPAHRDGKLVEAEAVLHFRFGPESR